MSEEYEPKIVAFLCNWCTYTAADLAGSSRLSYPQNVKIIRVMCSGMVDPMYVLKAFMEGADGVFIGGCWPGDCHYINGNLKARRRMAMVQELLERFGIHQDRFWLRWVAASDGIMFQKYSKEMTENLKKLGPSPIKKDWARRRSFLTALNGGMEGAESAGAEEADEKAKTA